MEKNVRDGRRPFVGVLFECCSVYQRLYLSKQGDAYRGHCPRCLRTVVMPVGEGGTDARIFRCR